MKFEKKINILMNRFIDYYKKTRTRVHLKKSSTGKYAFIGMGNHSINNLYPVLNYLNVSLKYIVIKTQQSAAIISAKFENILATNDLTSVLKDDEIAGVFICTNPANHFELTLQALNANKNVFVEKPPCSTLEELEILIVAEFNSKKVCLVGLQKRYSSCTELLKKKIKPNELISYNYRYTTGLYPEGDEVMDLFIHPLDLILHLFGDYSTISIQNTNSSRKENGTSIFIQLVHDNCVGNIEISTNYSWSNADETLLINTNGGIYKMENHELVTFEKKQGAFLSIPLEKISPNPTTITTLFHRNNFAPIMNNNQLFTMGYYSEIRTFVDLVENGKGNNVSTLTTLKCTFKLLNEIKNSYVH